MIFRRADITSKVVIITGASSGIGAATAIEFARKGAFVVLASRNIENLQKIEDSITKLGGKSVIIPTDVTEEEQCKRLIDKTIEKLGRIDILINNAGISMRASFNDVEIVVLKRLMDVNFWGSVYCTKAALPYLLQSNGSVVGICSIAGHVGLPGRTGYSASKFALRGFLETIRNEYIHKKLHVMTVSPGFTASNVRFNALTANGIPQGETPRDENGMMTAEKVAIEIREGIEKRKREIVLTLIEGKLAVFLNKWWPSLVGYLANRKMRKEPNTPIK